MDSRNKNIQIGVAMSGGVDSTVTAALLLEQGYKVHGFFMVLPLEEKDAHRKKAKQAAASLNIPLQCVDLQEEFNQKVISYFLQSYQYGLTPNPCIFCNENIKLGLFLDQILASGMDKVATGHYAKISTHEGQPTLLRSEDSIKDQSYFLCRLKSKQLKHLILPLSQWKKSATFEKASSLGFDFQGQESQDVCFLSSDLASFLTSKGLQHRPGAIISEDGKKLGEHNGLWRYTIGQRRGLNLPDATPWYVTSLDTQNNVLVVGKSDSLLSRKLLVHSVRWHKKPTVYPWYGHVQLRSRHAPAPARLRPCYNNSAEIIFDSAQRAITPGQYAAFYSGNRLIGSGIIDKD